jgi:hypothetical protein
MNDSLALGGATASSEGTHLTSTRPPDMPAWRIRAAPEPRQHPACGASATVRWLRSSYAAIDMRPPGMVRQQLGATYEGSGGRGICSRNAGATAATVAAVGWPASAR